jgi:hypothetical protein
MMEKGSALAGDLTGIIISATEPDPEDRDKAWIKLTAAGGPPVISLPYIWYNGKWVARHPDPASGDARRLWIGTTGALQTYDGGDIGAVSDVSGPMWEVDHTFDGRFPVGPGTIPGSAPAVTITEGATVDSTGAGGEYKHILTEAEGAVGTHTHPFGLTNAGNDDAYFARSGSSTVTTYTGYYITGSNGNIVASQTTADLFTLPSGTAGAGVTAAGHNNLPPYVGIYVVKRTARIFYCS